MNIHIVFEKWKIELGNGIIENYCLNFLSINVSLIYIKMCIMSIMTQMGHLIRFPLLPTLYVFFVQQLTSTQIEISNYFRKVNNINKYYNFELYHLISCGRELYKKFRQSRNLVT